MDKTAFIRKLLPYAIAAIGKQHGWLVRWALAKAAQECGWRVDNILIREANNCLGIKGGVPDDRGKWRIFDGVEVYWKQDSIADGRDDGMVPWRKFDSLKECFEEFVKMINSRDPYHPAREAAMKLFEDIYADHTPGHTLGVLKNYHEATGQLQEVNLCDGKGRLT